MKGGSAVSEQERRPKKSNHQERDAYWEVDRLMPARRETGTPRRPRPTPTAVEIEVPPPAAVASRASESDAANTPLTQVTPPRRDLPQSRNSRADALTIDDLLPPQETAPVGQDADRADASPPPPLSSSTPSVIAPPPSGEVHYVPPHTAEEQEGEAPLSDYRPDGVLLHRVQVFAWATGFHYFDSFAKEAADFHAEAAPEEAQRASFFSYFPQYVQMNRRQTAWYLWWREQVRMGDYPDTDYAYILLYLFELINLAVPDRETAARHRDAMAAVWMAYRPAYPQLDRYMCEWLCDYCLIHELPAPLDILAPALDDIIAGSRLKEFYLVAVIRPEVLTDGQTEDSRRARRNLLTARILMRHCCQYDYRKSKFASGEHKELFERTIPAAVAAVLPLLLGSEGHPPVITMQDSTVTRDAFTGALCSYKFKRKITVSYTSFSRSHDLRFLIGDMVKHVENTLRSWIGVRSRLSIMSLPIPLRDALDAYLAPLAPKKAPPPPKKKREPERPQYEALYDLPAGDISPTAAADIEANSWETTRILTEAFADGEEMPEPKAHGREEPPAPPELSPEECAVPSEIPAREESIPPEEAPALSPLAAALGDRLPFLRAALAGDRAAQRAYAEAVRKMPDAIADEINAVTAEVEIFDMVLEEDGGGFYCVIEDYRGILESI